MHSSTSPLTIRLPASRAASAAAATSSTRALNVDEEQQAADALLDGPFGKRAEVASSMKQKAVQKETALMRE